MRVFEGRRFIQGSGLWTGWSFKSFLLFFGVERERRKREMTGSRGLWDIFNLERARTLERL